MSRIRTRNRSSIGSRSSNREDGKVGGFGTGKRQSEILCFVVRWQEHYHATNIPSLQEPACTSTSRYAVKSGYVRRAFFTALFRYAAQIIACTNKFSHASYLNSCHKQITRYPRFQAKNDVGPLVSALKSPDKD